MALAMTVELLITKESYRTFDANTGKRLRQPSRRHQFPFEGTGEEGEAKMPAPPEPKSDQGCGCGHISSATTRDHAAVRRGFWGSPDDRERMGSATSCDSANLAANLVAALLLSPAERS